MTSWPSLKSDLNKAGAHWVDAEVIVDEQFVTSRKPDDIPVFNREMIELFSTGVQEREPLEKNLLKNSLGPAVPVLRTAARSGVPTLGPGKTSVDGAAESRTLARLGTEAVQHYFGYHFRDRGCATVGCTIVTYIQLHPGAKCWQVNVFPGASGPPTGRRLTNVNTWR